MPKPKCEKQSCEEVSSKDTLAKIEKILEKENVRIEKDNDKFSKMTKAQQRVQIARDVLAQLASKRLIATPGTWLTAANDRELIKDEDIDTNAKLKDILSKQKKCEGCALGGMFMCAVERSKTARVSDLEEGVYGDIVYEDTLKHLGKYFSAEQLEMIETAFEQGEGAAYSSGYDADFCEGIEDAEERMRLIMENIVVNKGKFVPSKRPKAIYTTPGFKG